MTRFAVTLVVFVGAAAMGVGSPGNAEVTQADIDAYNAAADAFNQRVERYERAATEFNAERDSFHHAVDQYNSLPPDQRTQFQYDRLQRWFNYLQQRLGQLNAERAYLIRRGAELEAWSSRLDG
jgi:beta-N-acetylglucosaminidase